jgi:hypothetical protein
MNHKFKILLALLLFTTHVQSQQQQLEVVCNEGFRLWKPSGQTADGNDTIITINNNRDVFWFNLGLGGSNRGIAMGIAGSYQFKNMVFSTRLIGNQSVCFSESNPCPWVSDIALLFGYMKRYSSLRLALATGISLVQGIDRGDPIPGSGGSGFFTSPDYYDDYYRKFGVPIEVQLFAAPVSFMGAGLYLFGNINSRRSFFGVMVSLQFGIFNKQYQ